MYQALYRKWRPRTFDDVYGQEHITSILKYETENNKFSHAYLFCGSRGTGKTTCAKILAKAVNCEAPVGGSPCNKCPSCLSIDSGAATDVLEMDAASNNGVDNIRDIRDEVVYMPSALKYRVYIVDEVHMLSGSAFNALLKTLEEPPAHVVFVLATTELHKLPSTIISRCQRFDFRRISTDVLVSRLKYIAKEEGISYEDDALRLIAKHAQGGMRDAISLFELCAGNRTKITAETVADTIGSGGRENIERTVKAIAEGDFDGIFSVVEEVVSSSKDITVFLQELLSYYRDMLVMKTTKSADKYLDLTDLEAAGLKGTAELFSSETLLAHCRILDEALYSMQKMGNVKRTVAEMALIKLGDSSLDSSNDALLSRISRLERELLSLKLEGVRQAPPTSYDEAMGIDTNETTNATSKAKTADKSDSSNITDKSHISNVSDVSDTRSTEKKPERVTVTEKKNLSESELKQYRGWNELAEKAAGGDMAILPFLRMAKAFIAPDGKIQLRFPSDFAKGMSEKETIKRSLCAAFEEALQRKVLESDLVFMLVLGNEDSISDLDDLII